MSIDSEKDKEDNQEYMEKSLRSKSFYKLEYEFSQMIKPIIKSMKLLLEQGTKEKHYYSGIFEEIPTLSFSKYSEYKQLQKENRYLIKTNWVLSKTNDGLTTKLTELTQKYNDAFENSTKATTELKDEVAMLRKEIKEIEKVRSITVDVPDSWIIKD